MSRAAVNLRHAWRALRASPRRFAFSCASLSIGMGAMIAVLGIGESIHAHALRQFEGPALRVARLSSNSTTGMNAAGEPQRDRLDTALLRRLLPPGGPVPRMASLSRLVQCEADGGSGAEVIGVEGEIATMLGPGLAAGRVVGPVDGEENWALFGYETAREVTQRYGHLPLGGVVSVCGVRMRMAGVLQKTAEDGAVMPFNLNRTVFLNHAALKRMAALRPVGDVLLHYAAPDEVDRRAERVRHEYRAATGLDVVLATPGKTLAMLRAQESALISSLLVTGLVVLFIGAFGIMENLLSSVNERRAEIGIRLSVGASPADIRSQFAGEALMLVSAGGVTGLLLGTAAAYGYAQLRGMPFVVSAVGMAAALGLVGVVGFCSGYFPARRAAGVDPVVAVMG